MNNLEEGSAEITTFYMHEWNVMTGREPGPFWGGDPDERFLRIERRIRRKKIFRSCIVFFIIIILFYIFYG